MGFAGFHPRFGGRATAVAGAAVLCVAIGRAAEHAYVAAWAAGAILLLGLAWPWLAMRRLSAKVRATAVRCRAGSGVELSVEVRNAGPLPIPAVELVTSDESDLTIEAAPIVVRPGQHRLNARLIARRRGVLDLGGFKLATSFPFGMLRVTKPAAGAGRLIVWPVAEPVPETILGHASHTLIADTTSSRVAAEGELSGVRSYRRGDAMRAIHWQQTARHDRLIVRERAGCERRGCVVWLDTRRGVYDAQATFERAVSLAAGVIEQGVKEGISVELRTASARIVVADEQASHQALDHLAAIVLGSDDQSPTAGRIGAGSLVITSHKGWPSIASGMLTPLFADSISREELAP